MTRCRTAPLTNARGRIAQLKGQSCVYKYRQKIQTSAFKRSLLGIPWSLPSQLGGAALTRASSPRALCAYVPQPLPLRRSELLRPPQVMGPSRWVEIRPAEKGRLELRVIFRSGRGPDWRHTAAGSPVRVRRCGQDSLRIRFVGTSEGDREGLRAKASRRTLSAESTSCGSPSRHTHAHPFRLPLTDTALHGT